MLNIQQFVSQLPYFHISSSPKMLLEFNLVTGFDLLTCIKFIFIAFVLIKALQITVCILRKKLTFGNTQTHAEEVHQACQVELADKIESDEVESGTQGTQFQASNGTIEQKSLKLVKPLLSSSKQNSQALSSLIRSASEPITQKESENPQKKTSRKQNGAKKMTRCNKQFAKQVSKVASSLQQIKLIQTNCIAIGSVASQLQMQNIVHNVNVNLNDHNVDVHADISNQLGCEVAAY